VAKKRRAEEGKPPNHERWVISYADFMTLLLATFVVLYAVSSINVSRYRQAAEALAAVFNGRVIVPTPGEGSNPNGIFDNLPAPIPHPMTKPEILMSAVKPQPSGQQKEGKEGKDANSSSMNEQVRDRTAKLDAAYHNLVHLLKDLIDKGQVHVAFNGFSVVIDINASVLFDSGKADLTASALVVIDQIGVVLKDLPYRVQVNGFTDNAPIHTVQFDSNWELSAIRAISVVRRFVGDGVDPSYLVGAGYGEYHPVAANGTPDGMSQNRRVSIVVVSADETDRAGTVHLVNGDEARENDRAGASHPIHTQGEPGKGLMGVDEPPGPPMPVPQPRVATPPAADSPVDYWLPSGSPGVAR
jgi:chemotaxis protein MotB